MYIKAELSVLIINKMSVYCPARITVEPLIDGLIYGRKVNGRNRFWINRDVEVKEKHILIGELFQILGKQNIRNITDTKFAKKIGQELTIL